MKQLVKKKDVTFLKLLHYNTWYLQLLHPCRMHSLKMKVFLFGFIRISGWIKSGSCYPGGWFLHPGIAKLCLTGIHFWMFGLPSYWTVTGRQLKMFQFILRYVAVSRFKNAKRGHWRPRFAEWKTCPANIKRKVGQTIGSCLNPRHWKSSSVKAIEDSVKKWADPTYYDRMEAQVWGIFLLIVL